MVLTTICDLPNEILGHVFDLAVDRNPTGSACDERSYSYLIPNQINDIECPRNIMLVCRHWHRIALNEASIWTHLSSDKLLGPLPSVSLTSYWLSLSRGAELRLCLREAQRPPANSGAHTFKVLLQYAAQAHRVRSLEVHLSQLGLWHLNFFLGYKQFTILDELQIYMHPEVNTKDLNSINNTIQRLVSLRHLRLRQLESNDHIGILSSLEIQPTVVLSQWEHLETLDICTRMCMEDAARVIEACTSATTIQLGEISRTDVGTNVQATGDPSTQTLGVITLPVLQHLTLKGQISPIPLLQNFAFPNLISLTITSKRPSRLQYQALETLLVTQDYAEPRLSRIYIQNLYPSIPGGLPNFIRATRGLAAVKEVSISYSVPTIYHLQDLNQLPKSQAHYDIKDCAVPTVIPPPCLTVWIKTAKAHTSPLDVHVGWLSNTGGYTVVAQWAEDGSLKYLPRRILI